MSRTQKEATIIILDVGKNSKVPSGKTGTFFERAKSCVSKIIQRKIFLKKNDYIGLILMGTNDSSNALNSSLGGYEHICEAFELSLPNWEMIRSLENHLEPSNSSADWIDSLLVAMNFLHESSDKFNMKFAPKKIVLVSTLQTFANFSNMDKIIKGLQDMEAELNIINDNIEYSNLDESDDFYEKAMFSQNPSKTQQQKENERVVYEIIERSNGVLSDIDKAELLFIHFHKKAARAVPWNCPLTIGRDLEINVSVYICIQESKIVESFKTESIEPDVSVKYKTMYFKNDEEIELAEDNDTFIKGYHYGSTIVPYDTSLNMDYKSGPKCFTCYGFTSMNNIHSEYIIGMGSYLVVPQQGYESSEKKFAALIEAMVQENLVMIVRKVYRENSAPHMHVLIPKPGAKAHFILLELCYKEENITFDFPSLRSKKHTPSAEQMDVMDNLIDAMDLTDCLQDNTGIKEAFVLNKTLNPVDQHLLQCIAYRAVKPNEPLPKMSEELRQLVDIPAKIKENLKDITPRLKELFELKNTNKTTEKLDWVLKNIKKDSQSMEVSISTDDGYSTLSMSDEQQLVEVRTISPAEDFVELLKRGEKFVVLAKQIQNIISNLVFKAVVIDDIKVAKAIAAYREEAKQLGAFHYNDWIEEFKTIILNHQKKDFWENVIVLQNFGLITNIESDSSTVTDADAKYFYSATSTAAKSILEGEQDDYIAADDLFDEI